MIKQSTLAKLEIALERKIYQKSYYEFFKVAFAQLHPGQDYDENWHARYICDVLQAEAERIMKKEVRKKDIIINVPFRAAKSMIATIIFPVWCWAQDPSLKFITASYSESLAIEHSRRSRDLINSNWFQRLYGKRVMLKKDAGGIQHYETVSTGMRKAVGVGGAITGSGADIILCFRGDQLVTTDKGQIRIDEIVNNKLDVKAASFNFTTKSVEYKPILNHWVNKGKKLLKIKLKSGKEIVCTENHKIWTENRGWIEASDLNNKDLLKNA